MWCGLSWITATISRCKNTRCSRAVLGPGADIQELLPPTPKTTPPRLARCQLASSHRAFPSLSDPPSWPLCDYQQPMKKNRVCGPAQELWIRSAHSAVVSPSPGHCIYIPKATDDLTEGKGRGYTHNCAFCWHYWLVIVIMGLKNILHKDPELWVRGKGQST